MSERYVVKMVFHSALGWMSEVLDTRGTKRILVAGTDHKERAARRALELNAKEGGDERTAQPVRGGE